MIHKYSLQNCYICFRMNKLLCALSFISICFFAEGQKCSVPGIVGICGDTAQSYIIGRSMGLPLIADSNEVFHFRVWFNEIQVVDIEVLRNGICKGVLENYCTYSWGYRMHKHQYYSNRIDLDTANVRKVVNLFQSLSINSIPDCIHIKGWNLYIADGTYYKIEYCDLKSYSDKSYSNPQQSKSIKEGRDISAFIDTTYTTLNLGKQFHQFYMAIPKKITLWALLRM